MIDTLLMVFCRLAVTFDGFL